MSNRPSAPATDPTSVAPRTGTSYPKEHRQQVERRSKRALGDALGLSHYGVNLVELEPGAWSSQRHWHSAEDEFLYVVSGELTLITDAGRQLLGAGMVAGFPAGKADGHHLVNVADTQPGGVDLHNRLFLLFGQHAQEVRIHEFAAVGVVDVADDDLAQGRIADRWRRFNIAAIVGAAVGALHGKAAIPERWISNLSGRTSDRDDGRIFQILDQARKKWGD